MVSPGLMFAQGMAEKDLIALDHEVPVPDVATALSTYQLALYELTAAKFKNIKSDKSFATRPPEHSLRFSRVSNLPKLPLKSTDIFD